MSDRQRIERVEIWNIRGIKHAAFDLGESNIFEGSNEAGKTTILYAIYAAIKTAKTGLDPGVADLVRHDSNSGRIEITLSDGTKINRVLKPATSKDTVTVLTSKGIISKPAEFLQSLGYGSQINPLRFVEMDPREQVAELCTIFRPKKPVVERIKAICGLCLPEGLDSLTAVSQAINAIFNQRTGVNRTVKERSQVLDERLRDCAALEKDLEKYHEVNDLCFDSLTQELARVSTHNGEVDANLRRTTEALAKLDTLKQKEGDILSDIDNLKKIHIDEIRALNADHSLEISRLDSLNKPMSDQVTQTKELKIANRVTLLKEFKTTQKRELELFIRDQKTALQEYEDDLDRSINDARMREEEAFKKIEDSYTELENHFKQKSYDIDKKHEKEEQILNNKLVDCRNQISTAEQVINDKPGVKLDPEKINNNIKLVAERDKIKARLEQTKEHIEYTKKYLKEAEDSSSSLTKELEELRSLPAVLVREINIPGLTVTATPTKKGTVDFSLAFPDSAGTVLPFTDHSESSKLEFAINVAARASGGLALVTSDGLERCDAERLRNIKQACARAGVQLIGTKVTKGKLRLRAEK